MALPESRTEFAQYCLRKIGAGAIEINVTEDQINDRLEEALHYFKWHHYNGSEAVYLPFEVDATMKTNKYLDLDDPLLGEVIGATRVFRLGYSSTSLLTVDFAIATDALYMALRGDGLLTYAMLQSYRSLIQEMTSGTKLIRHNVHQKRVYIDMDWDSIEVGSFIILEAYRALDFQTFPAAYGDPWLLEYTANLIKLQWGENLGKYAQVQLPGGIVLNGAEIRQQAAEAIKEMEDNVINEASLPVDMLIG